MTARLAIMAKQIILMTPLGSALSVKKNHCCKVAVSSTFLFEEKSRQI
jgi:hypothetical protein